MFAWSLLSFNNNLGLWDIIYVNITCCMLPPHNTISCMLKCSYSMNYQGHVDDFNCVLTANRTIYQILQVVIYEYIHQLTFLTCWPSDILKDSVKHLTQICSREADWALISTDLGHTVGRLWICLIQHMSHLHQTESIFKKNLFKLLIFFLK